MTVTREQLLFEKFLRDRNSGSLVWKTKDGREIPIKDLTDEHLDNILSKPIRIERGKSKLISPSSLNFY